MTLLNVSDIPSERHPTLQIFRFSAAEKLPLIRCCQLQKTKRSYLISPCSRKQRRASLHGRVSTRLYKGSSHFGTFDFIAGIVTEERSVTEQFVGQYSAESHQYQLGLAVVVQASLIKQAILMLPSPETLPNF